MSYKIIELDSALKPYENDIKLRMDLYHKTRKELLGKNKDIVNFASGADYAKKVYIRRNPKVAEAIARAEQELDIDELKAFEEKM